MVLKIDDPAAFLVSFFKAYYFEGQTTCYLHVGVGQ